MSKKVSSKLVVEMLAALRSAYGLMQDADTSELPAEAGARFAAVKWQVQVAIAKAEGRQP